LELRQLQGIRLFSFILLRLYKHPGLLLRTVAGTESGIKGIFFCIKCGHFVAEIKTILASFVLLLAVVVVVVVVVVEVWES
jgi:hypothetical protein